MKHMYIWCLVFFIALSVQQVAAQFRIVGYLNTWDNFPDNAQTIDFTRITHLNIAFANPDAKGNLTTFPELSKVVNNAHADHVKVLMSLGGADLGGTDGNWRALTCHDQVNTFCQKLLKYVLAYNLDGLDVDLEGNIIGKNYGSFIQTLSSILKPKGKLVTAAVATWFADQIPASSFNYFDFVNVMSYDATGPWDPQYPGPHSPFSMAVNDLDFWAAKGLPKSKTGLGVPFYGWGFYNKASGNEYAYGDLVKQYPGAEKRDKIADTIYYNGIPTIIKKTILAKQKASGIMIWQLTEDAPGKKSLLNAINETVNRGKPATHSNATLIDNKGITIMPNPTHGTLQLHIKNNSGNVYISIKTLDGREAMPSLTLTSSVQTINTSILPAGTYILNILIDKKIITQKIVKL